MTWALCRGHFIQFPVTTSMLMAHLVGSTSTLQPCELLSAPRQRLPMATIRISSAYSLASMSSGSILRKFVPSPRSIRPALRIRMSLNSNSASVERLFSVAASCPSPSSSSGEGISFRSTTSSPSRSAELAAPLITMSLNACRKRSSSFRSCLVESLTLRIHFDFFGSMSLCCLSVSNSAGTVRL